MRPRVLIPVLLCAALSTAQDDFARDLAAFEKARKLTLEPGSQALLFPAVERLVATGDIRAIRPLTSFLAQTLSDVTRVFEIARKGQKSGSGAYDRMHVLDKELEHLRLKLSAGDESVGPAIERRVAERKKQQQVFNEARAKQAALTRVVDKLRLLRVRVEAGIVEIIKGLKGAARAQAFVHVREALDVADKDQGLFLVRILRDSGHPEAQEHLISLLTHPNVPPGVRSTACLALARYRSREGCTMLLQLAQRDESLRPTILHALGRAAEKPLPDLDAAKQWVATLK